MIHVLKNREGSVFTFCEARTKRSVEVYKGKNLDSLSPPPLPPPAHHRP